MLLAAEGGQRGHDGPRDLVLGLGPHGLDGPWLLGFCLLSHHGPPEWPTNRCPKIPGVSLHQQYLSDTFR
jgi:hypothetical protein